MEYLNSLWFKYGATAGVVARARVGARDIVGVGMKVPLPSVGVPLPSVEAAPASLSYQKGKGSDKGYSKYKVRLLHWQNKKLW